MKEIYRPLLGVMRKYSPIYLYAALALVIMAPLLNSGYLLTLDITRFLEGAAHPEIQLLGMEGHLSEGFLYYLTASGLNIIFPDWLTQKLFFFLALFLAGWGAHRLCPGNNWAKYYAGILYMINPFIYIRLLVGQLGVALGYALLPLAINHFINLLETNNRKNLLLTVVFLSLICTFSLHIALLALLSFLVIFIVKIIQMRRTGKYIINTTVRVIQAAIAFLMVNIYWISSSQSLNKLNVLGEGDISVFTPQATLPGGPGISLLSMYGFWRGGYIYANDIIPGWWIFAIVIVLLAFYGFFYGFKHPVYGVYVKSISIIGIIAFILALGASIEPTKHIFTFLWQNIILFRSFRDTQKFIALLVLAYSFLGGIFISHISVKWESISSKLGILRRSLLIVLFLIPLINCFSIFNGFWGQLRPVYYPDNWHEVKQYIDTDKDDFNILFLPWHAWMDYSWLPNSDQRLVCPAGHFFTQPVIRGDNIESGTMYTQSTNPISKYIDFLLRNRNEISNMGELLAPLNIKYVILVQEADYEDYNFLYSQEDLNTELELSEISLFKNEHTTSKAYGVNNVVYIENLDDFLIQSKEQDVMEHIYFLDNTEINTQGIRSKVQKLTTTKLNPITYEVEGSTLNYTIFTVPQNVSNTYWKYNEQLSLNNLGFMPVFVSAESGGGIVFHKFYDIYLPSIAISLISIFALSLWVIRRPTDLVDDS